MLDRDWLYSVPYGAEQIIGNALKDLPEKSSDDDKPIDLSESMKLLVDDVADANVICEEMKANLRAIMNEKGIGFVTMNLLDTTWIKYWESDRHVFWTPVDNLIFPSTYYSDNRFNSILEWLSSRIDWEIGHVKIAIPSKFQYKKIHSFFERNRIKCNDFWHKPSFFDKVINWLSRKMNSDKEIREFRPIIIENKLGGEKRDEK